MARALAGSAGELFRLPASSLAKRPDSGERRFAIGELAGDALRQGQRRWGVSRPARLARVFALALFQTVARSGRLRLMVPRDARAADAPGGNAFVPHISTFEFSGEQVAQRPDGSSKRHETAALAETERLRLQVMRLMPRWLRGVAYRQWANGFDALCTILPNRFGGMAVGDARVVQVFGVPPLIWRQPLSAAFVVGRRTTDVLIAWDPAAIDAAPVMPAIERAAGQLCRPGEG